MADTKKPVKELTDRLEQGIKELFTSERYMEYLKTMARFSHYSTRNTLLIHMQNPDATLVAGFRKWETEFTRYVKKGEHGIKIFAPMPFTITEEKQKIDPETRLPVVGTDGLPEVEEKERRLARFKVIHVFDVSQTDGKPLPTLVDSITGDVANYDLFMDALKEVSPLPIVFEAMAENTDGYCEHGVKIAIREGMSEIQTVLAVIHEMTHARLHDIEALRLVDETAKPKDRRTQEVEAESVSYAVCQYYGIETGANSLGYIAEWSRGRELKEYNASLDTIRKATDELITAIDGKYRELAKKRGINLTLGIEQEQTAAAPAVNTPGSEQKYTAEFLNNCVRDVTARVLLDNGYLSARDGKDEAAAVIECVKAIERAVTSLFPAKLELYAFYKGDEGFRVALEDAVHDSAYVEYHKRLEEIAAASAEAETREEQAPPPKQATRAERDNYKKFVEMFPQIADGEYNYMRLESVGYEPLSIERTGENTFSMMHTYKMNGDLMYDPDITFEINAEAQTLSALTFEQSMPPLYQEISEDGNGQSFDGNGVQREIKNLGVQINSFLTQWLGNIEQQAFTPVRAMKAINGSDVEITFDADGNPVMPEPENLKNTGDERQRTVLDKDGSPHTEYFNDDGKKFWIGMGHMGNGLTVWNRLEEKDSDYVTVAHIGSDRTVKFYADDLPEAVKKLIEHEARSSDMSVSATQPEQRVFNTPPTYSLEYNDIPVYGLEVYNDLKELVAEICPNGAVTYHDTNLPAVSVDEINTRAENMEKAREAEFLNGENGTYGIYLFESLTGDSRISRDNYRLAYFGQLGENETLDTIRNDFTAQHYPYDYYPRSSGVPFGSGDIIALKQDGVITPWYVDNLAFSKQPDFFRAAEPQKVTEEQSTVEPTNHETTLDMSLPDPLTSIADRNDYGYTYDGMLPLSNERAAELFDADHTIYLLYYDNTESAAFDREEILAHDGLCGIEREDWERSPVYAAQMALAANSESSRESELLQGRSHDGMFGIYQLKRGDELHYHRFASMKEIESSGLSVERANYELVYTAPLTIRDTLTNLNKIYEDFNAAHPADFTGHSVSMSDVIVLQWRGEITAHYVDDMGFKPLNVFTGNEKQPEPERDDKTYSQLGNTFTPPVQTMSEHTAPSAADLEADVKAGKSISLLDLANAARNERRPGADNRVKPKERPSLLGRLEDKKEYVAAQGSGAPAQTTNKEASHE